MAAHPRYIASPALSSTWGEVSAAVAALIIGRKQSHRMCPVREIIRISRPSCLKASKRSSVSVSCRHGRGGEKSKRRPANQAAAASARHTPLSAKINISKAAAQRRLRHGGEIMPIIDNHHRQQIRVMSRESPRLAA